MSVVTGIMLLLGAADWDEEPIAEVQAWLKEHWRGQQLVDVVEDHSGGHKHPQFEAWAAGINMFDEEAFVSFVLEREWVEPECVVLVIYPEHTPPKVYRPGYSYHHRLAFEPQPIADQWKGSCSCGWHDTASLMEFPSGDEAVQELQRKHRDHAFAWPEV